MSIDNTSTSVFFHLRLGRDIARRIRVTAAQTDRSIRNFLIDAAEREILRIDQEQRAARTKEGTGTACRREHE
jgi:hypothetical protein